MFTGIVEERGEVRRVGRRLVVSARTVVEDAVHGASLAVNGVCLTVVEIEAASNGTEGFLGFDLSEETLARTALGGLREGHPVNLERPVTLLARLGGHLVQGHVDGVGVVARSEGDEERRVEVELPDGLQRYLVDKGSVTVDGVSLTVTEVRGRTFRVALVPHTLRVTTLGGLRAGDRVNIEVDLMAKYVERMLPASRDAAPGSGDSEVRIE
jgi:riboflavin synthase